MNKAVCLVLLCVFLYVAYLGSAEQALSSEITLGGAVAKSIRRSVDPVIVKGTNLTGMQGLALEGFRLVRFRGDRWEPVPFQIDELDEDELYVLPLGKKPNRDKGDRKEQLPDRLDGNDELVWMASDLGGRAPAQKRAALERPSVELEVRDPIAGGKGWVYLLWSRNPPERSARDYVRFDASEDRVHAEYFTLGYSPQKDLVYTTFLSVTPQGGGDETSLLDRINIRFLASIFLQSITFSRNEDDFVSEVIAYKDGPVRVMRRVANSMRLVMGLQSPKIIAYSMYYRDAIETPNVLHLPVGLGTVAKSIYFEGGSDYRKSAVGMEFYSSNNPCGVVVDGRMSPQEHAMDFGEHVWTMISGSQGHVMGRLEMGPGFREVLGKRLIYSDNIERSNAPENEPGQCPKIGFSFTNLLALKKGTYYYNVRFYFSPSYAPGMEKPYLDILDHPLEVKVTPIDDADRATAAESVSK